MSFVNVAPEIVASAAGDLEGIASSITAANAAAAAQTTGVAAAAADEVSLAIAALFGTHAQTYQALSAQASAFHHQFVQTLNAGVGAYASAEAVNVEQTLLNAVNAPTQALLGRPLIGNSGNGAAGLIGQAGSYGAAAGLTGGGAGSAAGVSPVAAAPAAGGLAGLFGRAASPGAARLESFGGNWLASQLPVLNQFVASQLSYANTIGTGLVSGAQSFGAGMATLPSAYVTAFEAIAAGDFSTAAESLGAAYANLFTAGVDASVLSNIMLSSPVGDLLSIPTLPGGIPQNFTNLLSAITGTPIWATAEATAAADLGLPTTLSFNTLGWPVTTLVAAGESGTAFVNAVQAGDPIAAIGALVNAPAAVVNGFLFGQETISLPIPLDIPFTSVVLNVPFGGLLTPMEPLTATVTIAGITSTITLGDLPFGGIIPALLDNAPQPLAMSLEGPSASLGAISLVGNGGYDGLGSFIGQGLPAGVVGFVGGELANIQQNVVNAVNAPVEALLGEPLVFNGLPLVGDGGVGSLLANSVTGFVGGELANIQQDVVNAVNAVNAPIQELLGDPLAFGENLLLGGLGLGGGLNVLPAASSALTVGGAWGDLFTNTVANLESLGSNWLADPLPFLNQFVDNQLSYASTIETSLVSGAQSFGAGLAALPAAYVTAFEAIAAGDFTTAAEVLGLAYANLFITGVDASDLSNIMLTGTVGDLLPILSIPGDASQNLTNVISAATDTNIALNLDIGPPVELDANLGLPMALAVNALGSPVTTLLAVGESSTAFLDAVEAGDPLAAIGALADAPANIADGFLNGRVVIPLNVVDELGLKVDLNLPFNGVLAPLQPVTATVSILGVPTTVTLGGTPIGGIIPALVNYAPQQLAAAIGA